uniref:ROK family protein n=1 Tax=Enterococcus faecium TaxID=1352 RepID=UPI00292F3B94
MIYGAIEAGGTKFVCAIGDEEMTIKERVSFPTTTGDEEMTIKERVSFPTTTPEETMPLVIDFFKQYQADLAGIGIG